MNMLYYMHNSLCVSVCWGACYMLCLCHFILAANTYIIPEHPGVKKAQQLFTKKSVKFSTVSISAGLITGSIRTLTHTCRILHSFVPDYLLKQPYYHSITHPVKEDLWLQQTVVSSSIVNSDQLF